MNDMFSDKRELMVNEQIIRRGVSDERVLNAMRSVKRELFLPEHKRDLSYIDGPVDIGYSQTISQPYIVAFMTEALELNGEERVLEIGTGSGYQTAILAEIANEVYTIEIRKELGEWARKSLTDLGYENIYFKIGDGKQGWKENSPYDRIILTAAPSRFPDNLFSQLKDNGIIVAPVGDYFQKLVKYVKKDNNIKSYDLLSVSFVPLI